MDDKLDHLYQYTAETPTLAHSVGLAYACVAYLATAAANFCITSVHGHLHLGFLMLPSATHSGSPPYLPSAAARLNITMKCFNSLPHLLHPGLRLHQ